MLPEEAEYRRLLGELAYVITPFVEAALTHRGGVTEEGLPGARDPAAVSLRPATRGPQTTSPNPRNSQQVSPDC